MATKRMTLKEGFLVRELKVHPCYFARKGARNYLGITENSFIVLFEGYVEVISEYNDEVFETENEALIQLGIERGRSVKFYREQIEYRVVLGRRTGTVLMSIDPTFCSSSFFFNSS